MTEASWIPNWIRRGEDNDPPQQHEAMPFAYEPTIAFVEKPRPTDSAEDDKMIFGRAAVLLEQLKRDRFLAEEREQKLQVDLAELVLASQGEAKKVAFLELENAELRNNIATLQSDVERYREFMSKIKQILDAFGIKAPEKKPRKARPVKKSQVKIEAVK